MLYFPNGKLLVVTSRLICLSGLNSIVSIPENKYINDSMCMVAIPPGCKYLAKYGTNSLASLGRTAPVIIRQYL